MSLITAATFRNLFSYLFQNDLDSEEINWRGAPLHVLEIADKLVLNENYKIRADAKTYDICHVTLMRYIRKKR